MTASPAAHVARPQTPVERLTIALIPAAEHHLQSLQQRTNLSKTDLTNRAITSYEFIEAQLRAGRDLLVRDNQTGQTQLVRLLLRASRARWPPSEGGGHRPP